jgi:hypothetical protein
MTEDEKRQQKAMLLLEYHEAEVNLAHLEVKAANISKRLGVMSEWLERASKRNDPLHEEFYAIKTGGNVSILNDPDVALSMDFSAAVKLVREIRDGRAAVNDLYKRKQSLGLQ